MNTKKNPIKLAEKRRKMKEKMKSETLDWAGPIVCAFVRKNFYVALQADNCAVALACTITRAAAQERSLALATFLLPGYSQARWLSSV